MSNNKPVSGYTIPSHIEIKCVGKEIHLYKKTNSSFYRNFSYDLEQVAVFENEDEFADAISKI